MTLQQARVGGGLVGLGGGLAVVAAWATVVGTVPSWPVVVAGALAGGAVGLAAGTVGFDAETLASKSSQTVAAGLATAALLVGAATPLGTLFVDPGVTVGAAFVYGVVATIVGCLLVYGAAARARFESVLEASRTRIQVSDGPSRRGMALSRAFGLVLVAVCLPIAALALERGAVFEVFPLVLGAMFAPGFLAPRRIPLLLGTTQLERYLVDDGLLTATGLTEWEAFDRWSDADGEIVLESGRWTGPDVTLSSDAATRWGDVRALLDERLPGPESVGSGL